MKKKRNFKIWTRNKNILSKTKSKMKLAVGMAIIKSSKFVQDKSSLISVLIMKRIGFHHFLVYRR